MSHHRSNDQALPFSPFSPGSEAGAREGSFFKTTIKRLFSKSLRQMPHSPISKHEAAEPADVSIVSPYDVDDYGRPKVLSNLEIVLHALAWPFLVGVVVAYGLAIFLVAVHTASISGAQEKVHRTQIASLEAAR